MIRHCSGVDGFAQFGIEPDWEGVGRTRTHRGTARTTPKLGQIESDFGLLGHPVQNILGQFDPDSVRPAELLSVMGASYLMQQRFVHPAHLHGVDHDLGGIVAPNGDDLEQIPGHIACSSRRRRG